MIANAVMPSLASTLIPCFAGAGPMDAGTAAACCVWAIEDDDCGWGGGPTLLMSAPHLTQKRPLRGAPHLTQKLAMVNAPCVCKLEPAAGSVSSNRVERCSFPASPPTTTSCSSRSGTPLLLKIQRCASFASLSSRRLVYSIA